MDKKFNLKWEDFQPHITNSYTLLRNDSKFCDVTLVSDDQKQIAAHKVVLSACSEYFSNILSSNNHGHPLLCLDGITSEDLKNIVDYIYRGEIEVSQDKLERFFKIGTKFKLNGLLPANDGDVSDKREQNMDLDLKHQDNEIQSSSDFDQFCIEQQEEIINEIMIPDVTTDEKSEGQDLLLHNTSKRRDLATKSMDTDSILSMFPYPWSVKRSRRCVHCLDNIRGVGFSEAYKQLYCQPRQCQKCANCLCKDHLMIVCRPCIQSLVVRS